MEIYKNFGKYNIGEGNYGNHNCGDYNFGNWNCGDNNSGSLNSGNHNSGNFNSGCYNSGNYNSGVLNTLRNPKIYMFNKISKWRATNWITSIARDILEKMPKEKENRQSWWNNLSKEDKKQILNLPNFNKKIFKEITGIDVSFKSFFMKMIKK